MLPEVLEPLGRKLRVSNGVLDVLVPEVVLQGARVLAIVGEFETDGMAEHVRVQAKRHLRPNPSLVIILRNPTALMGAPRSLMNASSGLSSWRRRKARSWVPVSG